MRTSRILRTSARVTTKDLRELQHLRTVLSNYEVWGRFGSNNPAKVVRTIFDSTICITVLPEAHARPTNVSRSSSSITIRTVKRYERNEGIVLNVAKFSLKIKREDASSVLSIGLDRNTDMHTYMFSEL